MIGSESFKKYSVGIVRDFDPNGPFEDTEPDNVLSHRKRSNEEPISLKKHPSLKGYVPREMCLTANNGYNSDLLRNAASSG